MAFIDEIKERAKADKKTIVLPESMDKRTFEAAEKILKEGIANLIIIGTPEEIAENSKGITYLNCAVCKKFCTGQCIKGWQFNNEIHTTVNSGAAAGIFMNHGRFAALYKISAHDGDTHICLCHFYGFPKMI